MTGTDKTTATISVLAINRASGGRLLALADVEIVLDGIPIVIHGVQVRADANGSEVSLPKYRGGSGEWRAAISLPDELKGPMGDAVLAAGIEAGILVAKSTAA